MSSQQNGLARGGTLALTVLAGAWTLFHLIWNVAKQTADDYWGIGLLILFLLALILAFVQFFQERTALKAGTSTERFPEPAIAKFFLASEGSAAVWFVVRMNVGAEWLLAGWEKAQSPAWGTSGKALTGFVAGALARASGPNPAVQGWYAWFLQHLVLPNAGLYSFLVTYGEFAVGLGLLLGILTGIAAGFGVLMNLNYLLAGTVSVNPVLGMFGLFLFFSWRVCGWIGGRPMVASCAWITLESGNLVPDSSNIDRCFAVKIDHIVFLLSTRGLLPHQAARDLFVFPGTGALLAMPFEIIKSYL